MGVFDAIPTGQVGQREKSVPGNENPADREEQGRPGTVDEEVVKIAEPIAPDAHLYNIDRVGVPWAVHPRTAWSFLSRHRRRLYTCEYQSGQGHCHAS